MSMVSEITSSGDNEQTVVGKRQVERASSSKKNQYKVPKKIHKAEREKLKRDHLNELFHELGLALEPTRQSNGKASILGDTSRLLRDLLTQVKSLRKENAVLTTESHYVMEEKNELIDENLALEAEIRNLQKELQERVQSNSAWGNDADGPAACMPQPPTTAITPPPVVGPIFVIPLNQELPPTYPPEEAVHHVTSPPKPPSHVRRPHARYPTPSDSWPLRILSQQQSSTGSNNPSNNG